MPRSHSMRGGRGFPPKRVIFVGCEGDSERAFVVLVQRYCDDAGHNVHLKTWVGGGGDSLAVVDGMVRHLNRASFTTRDRDEVRIARRGPHGLRSQERSGRTGERPQGRHRPLSSCSRTRKVCCCDSTPARSNAGFRQTKRNASSGNSGGTNKKPPNANDLQNRFSMDDLRRAARYDGSWQTVGLVPQRQRS